MTSDHVVIFDRSRLRLARDRAVRMGGRSAFFLHEWALQSLLTRLGDVRRNFECGLLLSPVQHDISHEKIDTVSWYDSLSGDEILTPPRQDYDLILANFCLHHFNDLPGLLIQIRRHIKPDGLMLAAMPGGETLHELRAVLHEAEIETQSGISPRIHPTADLQQMAGLMQRSGLALPVVDSDIVTVTYDTAFHLMHDLRAMGEGNSLTHRHRKFPSKSLFQRAAALYKDKYSDPDGRIRASFEIMFLTGWAPHENQPKPLPRGSATHLLADILEKQS
jgi:SAM-dependent methyltransferase